jgi:hypothetical protein
MSFASPQLEHDQRRVMRPNTRSRRRLVADAKPDVTGNARMETIAASA